MIPATHERATRPGTLAEVRGLDAASERTMLGHLASFGEAFCPARSRRELLSVAGLWRNRLARWAGTAVIMRMERTGLVTTWPEPGNRRLVWVTITPDGRKRLATPDREARQ